MAKVAIVILNWNGSKMMQRFLPTVMEYSRDEADVWVADNASTDDSMAMLAERFPQVKTVVLDRNYGFADGYNRGFRVIEDKYRAASKAGEDRYTAASKAGKDSVKADASLPEYYVLLNSDVEVTHHWLTPLVEFMDNHPEVCACQPKMLSEQDKDSFEYAGASGGFLDRYGYPFCRGRVFSTVERDDGQYDYMMPILWASGACLMIRREDYWRVGGLDARFFAHNEEIDLCWRLRWLGRKIVCLPESQVYHVGGGTLPKSNPMKTYLNFRNNLTMLYKNLPDDELHHVMRVRRWLDYLAAIEMLVLGRSWGDFKAVLRGRHAFKRWRHDFDADRLEIQRTRVVNHVTEQLPLSILWQYYARGRRTFKALSSEK